MLDLSTSLDEALPAGGVDYLSPAEHANIQHFLCRNFELVRQIATGESGKKHPDSLSALSLSTYASLWCLSWRDGLRLDDDHCSRRPTYVVNVQDGLFRRPGGLESHQRVRERVNALIETVIQRGGRT